MNKNIQNEKHPVTKIGNHYIDCVSREDLVKWCEADISSNKADKKIVFDVNGHGISLAATDPKYFNLMKSADIIHADGGFIVTLSRFISGNVIPERSATTDLIHDFAKEFSVTGRTFYLLGGTESANKKCFDNLTRDYPGLNIVGRRNGYFNDSEVPAIIDAINSVKPDVVWLGLGKPREQEFAVRWKDAIDTNWIITCGGCFNYISGDYSRAPLWMQKLNIEWVYRMLSNPRHLMKRYITTTPHAIWVCLTTK